MKINDVNNAWQQKNRCHALKKIEK